MQTNSEATNHHSEIQTSLIFSSCDLVWMEIANYLFRSLIPREYGQTYKNKSAEHGWKLPLSCCCYLFCTLLTHT